MNQPRYELRPVGDISQHYLHSTLTDIFWVWEIHSVLNDGLNRLHLQCGRRFAYTQQSQYWLSTIAGMVTKLKSIDLGDLGVAQDFSINLGRSPPTVLLRFEEPGNKNLSRRI